MSKSRIELMRDDLIAEFSAIKAGSTYRNSVVLPVQDYILEPDSIVASPMLSVIITDETIPIINSTKTVFSSHANIMIIGYVKAGTSVDSSEMTEAIESLAHDLKKCFASFTIKYVNQSANRWLVRNEPQPKVMRWTVPKSNIGWVTLEFAVTIHAQGVDF